MKNFGKTIKSIRTGKGYSQHYVSDGICTQGNYSKFEIGEAREIRYSAMYMFLNRLEMSFAEFIYIDNEYEMVEREKIIHDFFYQTYNTINNLTVLKNDCSLYLTNHPNDNLVKKIYIVLEGMTVLAKSNDFSKAIEIVYPIWEELSSRNTLYLTDIYLLNSILFLFPIETATQIKEFAFRHIEKYKDFQDTYKIKINFLMNLSLINIKRDFFDVALDLINTAIELCKNEQMFINLSVCYVRKGICLKNMKHNDEQFIKKGFDILKQLEQVDLINILKIEVDKYLNK